MARYKIVSSRQLLLKHRLVDIPPKSITKRNTHCSSYYLYLVPKEVKRYQNHFIPLQILLKNRETYITVDRFFI